ncbi:MlaA family lipoprotein [Sphingomonas jatrophae]|uniref:Phospholipid-binding lipoprotein MlaA n=1 Tax=Sphingomonas jatrophae TaxID=1166337 RepID=A0A1I6LHD6_9SPHN|nr:VacJ family lipoprotein [Sphingomonas jatrophae]SFS02718.1 phospholipid-binding lipoprotein MlaA [Sphingomonas jatrophae]
MRLFAHVAVIALASAAVPAAAWQLPAASASPSTPPPAAADGGAASQAAGADLTPPEAPIDAATADAAAASLTGGEAPLADAPRDPLEGFNRAVWGFNQTADRFVVKPVTVVYRFVTPRPVRRGVSRIFANLNEPWSFINNLLQGKPGRAVQNLGRFVVNTTVGVAGLGDPASDLGIRPAPEDFGQTLARWGIKSSTYIVLPLLGPSTIRDGIGSGVAMVADPYNICLQQCTNLNQIERLGFTAAELVSIRSDLIESGADTFLQTSLDPYAAARSAYLQGRATAIADAEDDAGTAGETPASLDPTSADAPPPETGSDAATTPAGDAVVTTPATEPVTPPADPAPADTATTPPDTAATPSPTLAFNLATLLEG